ncbi:unnamed protein product, partial [Rotaria socialis]
KGDETSNYVPIGRPLSNTYVYLLDEFLQAVIPGQQGEIVIGGAGVFAGYAGDEDITKKVLIELNDGLGKCYRTGDFGRLNVSTGQLEYVCRRDNQVKLRGQRIESSEIESQIVSSHACISNCVVTKVTHTSLDHLVAYVQRQSNLCENDEQLIEHIRSYCKERLASFMVPSLIMLLDQFPLLHSGKVNRHQLPAPNFSLLGSFNHHIQMPRTDIERKLAALWIETLYSDDKINNIDINTSFFSLGGNSLMLMKLHFEYGIKFNI